MQKKCFYAFATRDLVYRLSSQKALQIFNVIHVKFDGQDEVFSWETDQEEIQEQHFEDLESMDDIAVQDEAYAEFGEFYKIFNK